MLGEVITQVVIWATLTLIPTLILNKDLSGANRQALVALVLVEVVVLVQSRRSAQLKWREAVVVARDLLQEVVQAIIVEVSKLEIATQRQTWAVVSYSQVLEQLVVVIMIS